MDSKLKRFIILSSIAVIILFMVITSIMLINYINNKKIINKVVDTYSNNNIQDRLDTNENNLNVKIDGNTVIGVIRIDKIGFEGLIYEGTEKEIIDKGVGHFPSTPYLNGNVGLAAHNTRRFWSKLYTLEPGDTISYISFLGSKEYIVVSSQIIDETDLSYLEDTDNNRLTLITCVYKSPSKRLCVQSIEK